MPTSLAPRKQKCGGVVYWVVSLGKRYTGGIRHRKYFRSRAEASRFIRNAEQARIQMGREAFTIPLGLRAEALACQQQLTPLRTSLSQAVEFFVRNGPRPNGGITFNDLHDDFIRSRKALNCRERTIVQYESYFRVIGEEFGNSDVNQMQRQDIEDWLAESEWSPRTRRNYLVTLTTVLGFAVSKGYRTENPALGISRPILDDRPPGILSAAQAESLLSEATRSDPKMAPILAIGLFAGLRRSEMFVLEWDELDLKERTIEVKGIKAKTRQRRIVQILPNLIEWLTPHQRKAGRVSSEKHIDLLSQRVREIAKRTGIDPWPHNAMRHSFGSYLLAETKNENLTASEMGNSPGIVIRHYRAVVRSEEAARYWRIVPPSAKPAVSGSVTSGEGNNTPTPVSRKS